MGPAGALGDWMRSLHFVDFLFPFLGLAVLVHFWDVVDGLGERLSLTLVAWILFVFTLGQVGIWLTGLWRDPYALFAGVAFAGKELEYVTLLAFGFLVGSRAPRWVRNVVLAIALFLAAWIVKEVLSPSGYYLLGLPFAYGAVQAGTVYAMLTLALLGGLGQGPASSDWEDWVLPAIAVVMALGVVLSGSRSSMLGLAAGAAVYGLQRARKGFHDLDRVRASVALGVGLLGACLIYAMEPSALGGMLNRWTGLRSGLEPRLERWGGLLSIIASKPWLMPFGAGLGTPNFLYFGREWGLLLAVDSGYVRRVFEVGIVGFALYMFLLGQIASQGERFRARSALPVLTAGIMAISLPMEAFQVSQAAGMFYTLAGVCLGRELLSGDSEGREGSDPPEGER